MSSQKKYSLVITGEWPGAGQSTTAKLLSEKLNFTRIYAGLLQRKFAFIWHLEKARYSWPQFQALFEADPKKLDDYHFTEADFNEKTLHQWQHQLKKVNTPEFWDKLIELHSLLALAKPGVVVEAKVGVLLDQTGLGNLNQLSHPVYKILLVCPPEISAHRVIKRKIENGELEAMDVNSPKYLDLVRETTTETIERHLRDWERYEKIYGLKRSDIYKPDVHQIFTTNKSPEEVVVAILDFIAQNSIT